MKWLRLASVVFVGAIVLAFGLVTHQRTVGAVISSANPANCYGNLNATPYPSGFTAGDFSSTTAATISNGKVQLDTALTPLDAQHIVLPFDQQVTVKYVYRNAGYSHSLGWFFFDQVQPYLDGSGKLADADHDGVPDFFQTQNAPTRPNKGLWQISGSNTIPDLINSSLNYSDGGNYAHIPNLLEDFMAAAGGMIFKICDDDSDTSTGNSLVPVADTSTTNDGIPDYDVNGNGTVGDAGNRSVNLGTISGNREVVFFAQTYGSSTLQNAGVGLATSTVVPPSMSQLSSPAAGGNGLGAGDNLELVAWNDASTGDHYLNWRFSGTDYTLATGNCVEWDYYIPTTSCLSGVGGIALKLKDGSWAATYAGYTGGPKSDFTVAGCGTWHHQKNTIPSSLNSAVVDNWYMTFENDTPNQKMVADLDNVKVTNCGSTVLATIYSSGAPGKNDLGTAQGIVTSAPSTTQAVSTFPWFTKNMLNPDRGAYAPNTVIRRSAIGCSRDDSTCYSAKHDAGGNAANLGWLDSAAMTRLATSTYGSLTLAGDNTVVDVASDADGNTPHFVTFAPASDPNGWILAFDNQPAYSGSDFDYNDVVFMIERTNGGEIVSNLLSSDIPTDKQATTVISKVRLRFTATYPSPACDSVTDAAVRLYYSVDGKKTWRQVSLSDKTTGDVTIDVLASGDVGNQLYWKAQMVSSSSTCNPVLASLSLGYEAVQSGEFKFAAPVPVANVVFTGAMETPEFASGEPSASAHDFSLRGHFRMTRLFDPLDPSKTALSTLWDAGAALSASSFSPSSRVIYTAVGGVAKTLTTANGSTLYPLLLSTSARATKYDSQYVYDFTGDGVVDDSDARFLLEWTRGWEYPAGVTMTPAQSTTARAWRLGAVHNSSPALVGPSPRPTWIDGSGVASQLVAAHNTFRGSNAARRSLALVGAQDGMLHAFDAGQFRYGSNAGCAVSLVRGCFAGDTDADRYGSGHETWAYVPPSQLAQLRNNPPAARARTVVGPGAEVDGSVAVEDVWDSVHATFKTVAFAALGRNQPYVTAVDVSGDTPAPLWADDFSDTDYHGSELSPSIGLTGLGGNDGTRFATVFTSGLSSAVGDLYLFVLDAVTGSTLGKVKLNTDSDTTQAYGFAGYPNLVDANGDGVIDRVYAADTSGRIWKYDFASQQHCVVAAAGETVYAGMALQVSQVSGHPEVRLFLGGAPNPDGTGTPASSYHLFAFSDDEVVGSCNRHSATETYRVELAAGQKVWAAPFLGTSQAYFATAGTTSLSVCLSADGKLYSLSTQGDGSDAPLGGAGTPVTLTGSPVSGVRAFDSHVFVNAVGGQTTIVGGATWNNAPVGSQSTSGNIASLPEISWEQL